MAKYDWQRIKTLALAGASLPSRKEFALPKMGANRERQSSSCEFAFFSGWLMIASLGEPGVCDLFFVPAEVRLSRFRSI